ncbi:NAD-dependent epimerase/dehydratase family protein [Kitasatospora griseola]|uniref:NAD-dependent epimerase/dehydratase family protein n=1 Tax=Kitasatospora griseola TaxID=2064 RepID=UPI00380F0B25
MNILVTGGTGTLGTLVVPRLLAAGCTVRVLSRRTRPDADGVHHVRGDLVAGTGLAEALDGVDTVLHLAGGAKGDDTARLVPDLAGPRVYAFADLLRPRRTLRVPLAGRIGRAYRDGRNLAGAGATRGTRTWEAFLMENS